eukprot:CAMPEP_0184729590 /NCGR_PEP_ID=MMETSP0314-20130426/44674_1 /TAXON_ID=38298 /ORGANISM="Rhodella maculata, Strain CCMP 736" /LENGTH=136 /DNA_ID=CAMNT_0027195635 /DNA_START=36 /DNA_END=442 /DNA_ORIENTATION=-
MSHYSSPTNTAARSTLPSLYLPGVERTTNVALNASTKSWRMRDDERMAHKKISFNRTFLAAPQAAPPLPTAPPSAPPQSTFESTPASRSDSPSLGSSPADTLRPRSMPSTAYSPPPTSPPSSIATDQSTRTSPRWR